MENKTLAKNKYNKFITNIINIILVVMLVISTKELVSSLENIKIESCIEYFEKRMDFDTGQVKIGKELFKKYNNISDYNYNMALTSLNYLPKKLLATLKDSGLNGVISEDSFISYSKDAGFDINLDERLNISIKNINACYMPWHHIFVSAKLDDFLNFNLNLVHEIGHSYDYLKYSKTHGILSQENEFMDIYNSNEKESLFYYNDYYTKSEREYFAESFALYYVNPTYLNDKAPRTYRYFENILSIYNE